MPIVVAGINHKTAPLGLLERLAVGEDRIEKALHQLQGYEHVLEGAILSTCNRVEVYANVSRFHAGAQDLRNFLAEFCHIAPEEFVDSLYTYHDDGAVDHLFRVAAGIDSMIVGESEILGQVKRALARAEEAGLMGRFLRGAFERALRVGKRVRTETAIGRNPVSIASAAVDLARRELGVDSLAGKVVALVGAGKMGRLTARSLASAGVVELVVVNRTEDRARNLAELFGATVRPMEDLAAVLANADIVISSTTSPHHVIDRAVLEQALERRSEARDLVIVDIAVPRDVDPDAADLDGVAIRDIDDLRRIVESGRGRRLEELSNVEAIIGADLQRFRDWERSTEVGPTVAAIVARAEEIRRQEVARIARSRGPLDPRELSELDRVTKRIVAKLLHEPLERVRATGSSKEGHLHLDALRDLFGLDDAPLGD